MNTLSTARIDPWAQLGLSPENLHTSIPQKNVGFIYYHLTLKDSGTASI